MTLKRFLSACAALAFAVVLLAAMPLSAGITSAAYAEEGGSGQVWCPMCDKPFPCGYEGYDEQRDELIQHTDAGDGTIVEYRSPAGGGFMVDEPEATTVDTGGAHMGGSQGQDGNSFGVDAGQGSGTGGLGDDELLDQETPTGAFAGLLTGFKGLMGDTMFEEDGAVKTWALAAGVIIIALIALGITLSAVRSAKKRRSRKARL